jgi:hypothetical protein
MHDVRLTALVRDACGKAREQTDPVLRLVSIKSVIKNKKGSDLALIGVILENMASAKPEAIFVAI